MNVNVLFMLTLILLLLMLILLLVFLDRKQKELVQQMNQTLESQSKLLDKSIGLLATKEPLAFQAVQAMTPGMFSVSDDKPPLSEEEEAKQYFDEHGHYPYSKDLDYDDTDLGPLAELRG